MVLCHFWLEQPAIFLIPFYGLRGSAVHVFMFMSFFLTQKAFLRRDKKYAIQRMVKLLYPQLVWTIVYFLLYWLIGVIIHQKLINGYDFLGS